MLLKQWLSKLFKFRTVRQEEATKKEDNLNKMRAQEKRTTKQSLEFEALKRAVKAQRRVG